MKDPNPKEKKDTTDLFIRKEKKDIFSIFRKSITHSEPGTILSSLPPSDLLR